MFGNIFINEARAQTFSTADLEGTWIGHALTTGSGGAGWEYSTFTFDSAGNYNQNSTDSSGSPGSDSDQFNIALDGQITIAGASTFDGIMSTDKNIMVLTETWSANKYAIIVLVKTDGSSFSNSDFSGDWSGHHLTSGAWEGWDTSTFDFYNTSGNYNAIYNSCNGSSDPDTGRYSINSSGIITDEIPDTGDLGFHGVMSLDKNVCVMTNTFTEDSNSEYTLSILVKTDTSIPFSSSDLTGTWSGHLLTCGHWSGWDVSTHTFSDASGNFSETVYSSDGSSDSSTGQYNISITGIITEPSPANPFDFEYNGIMNLGKNIFIATHSYIEDSDKEYTLSILVKKADEAAAVPTVSEWGMIVFFMLLVGSALWVTKRKRAEIG